MTDGVSHSHLPSLVQELHLYSLCSISSLNAALSKLMKSSLWLFKPVRLGMVFTCFQYS